MRSEAERLKMVTCSSWKSSPYVLHVSSLRKMSNIVKFHLRRGSIKCGYVLRPGYCIIHHVWSECLDRSIMPCHPLIFFNLT